MIVDLATGEPSEARQFRISLKRIRLHIQRGQQFQWFAKIEINGGGLQKASKEGAFIAPTEGYASSLEYDFRPKDPDWDPEWDRGLRETFYFVTADAKYGRIQLRLHADSEPPPASLFVESWLNPSGSRILEPDDAR